MIRIRAALLTLLLALSCAPAFAQCTTTALQTQINGNLPSGEPQVLTAQSLRNTLMDMVNCAPITGGTPVANANLASMVARTLKCNDTASSGAPSDCNYPIFNVKDPAYGSFCNGSTDDSTAINAAGSAANAAGGGVVLFPNGVCIGENIVIYPNVIYQGQGRGATTIRGAAGTTTAVFITQNFASLKGSNTYAGPSKWALRDLTVDGNYPNRSSGDDLDVYGPDYIIEDVDFINSPAMGVYSEFAVTANCPTLFACLEARWDNVKVANNAQTGVQFNGPHDTQFTNVLVFESNNANSASYTGFGLGQSATYSAIASVLHDVHVYGCNGWGITVGTPIYVAGVQGESNNLTNTIAGGGILVTGAGRIQGTGLYAFSNAGVGISLGASTSGPSQVNTVNSFGNTGATSDGVYVNQGGTLLSNVESNSNGRDGLFLDTSSGASVINGLQVWNNTSAGVFWNSGAGNTSIIGINTFNNADGVNFGGACSQCMLTGSFNQDTSIDVNFGTGLTKSIVDVIINKASAGASWSGTIAGNHVRIITTGNDSVQTLGPPNTIANLPTCTAALEGAVAWVTNNATATWLGALSAGSGAFTPVFCTGASWIQG